MSNSPTPASSTNAPKPPLDGRGLPAGYPFQGDWEVTPRETKRVMDSGETAGPDGTLVLDCRRPDEFAVAKIDGAVLVPMDQVASRLSELEGKTLGRDRPIIVHCHHGRRSLKVTAELRAAGFSDVKSMAGGIDLWSIDIDLGVKRY